MRQAKGLSMTFIPSLCGKGPIHRLTVTRGQEHFKNHCCARKRILGK